VYITVVNPKFRYFGWSKILFF